MNRRIVMGALVAALTAGAGGAVASSGLPPSQEHQRTPRAPAIDTAEYPPELIEQLAALRQATERFRDHSVAVSEGYELVAGDGPLMGEHWVRRDLVDRPFDITAPSTLQYLQVDGEYLLTGVAYTVYRAPDDPLPQGFAGDLDAWHVHDMMKISMATTQDRPLLRWITERRIANGRTQWSVDRPELTMVHAWVWLENPDGVFAQDHRLIPYVRAGLPLEWGLPASIDAAHGVALLDEEACGREVRRTSWMAGATWRQRAVLRDACREAENDVLRALAQIDGRLPSTEARQLNSVAEQAWRTYVQRRGEVLTEEQRARLAVAIEHPRAHDVHR